MIKVAVVGLGFMGQTHVGCYANNPLAQVVAVGARDLEKLKSGVKIEGNIESNQTLDLSGIETTTDLESLVEDPEVDLVSLCLPTRQHARFAVAALSAGKHVLCEKPFAWTTRECDEIIEAQEKSGKMLLVGHCLRFWPQYVRAHELLEAGELGEILHARFFRFSAAPTWSRWLMDGAQSGGAVLDFHIHDIDTALWWFGVPEKVRASGVVSGGLPLQVDASWTFKFGPHVQLSGGWDPNGGSFSMGFELRGARNSLVWNSAQGDAMQLFGQGGQRSIEVSDESAYQLEIDYFVECISKGEQPARITPQGSRKGIELAREELTQLGFTE